MGQLVRLAAENDRISAAGAEVIAISVNEVERQAGLRNRWKLDEQLLVSDPGGERYLQPLNLFDPEARGGLALPGVIVIASDGTEVYRYQGRDFADRTTDAEMFAALEGLGLPAIEAPDGGPEIDVPDDLKGFFTPEIDGPLLPGQHVRRHRYRRSPVRSGSGRRGRGTSSHGQRHPRGLGHRQGPDLNRTTTPINGTEPNSPEPLQVPQASRHDWSGWWCGRRGGLEGVTE